VQRHTHATEFDVSAVSRLPRVDILLVYQDASGDLIRAAVDSGAAGIVIAGAGAGSTSGTQSDAIDYALDKRRVVVMATRAGSGRIAPTLPAPSQTPGNGDRSYGQLGYRVFANDLAPLKARVLLMLALTRTTNPAEIQRMFTEY
jgi:L-asparaginase